MFKQISNMDWVRWGLATVCAACVLTSVPARAGEVAQTDLPRTHLQAGKATMDVQIASTFHQRQVGLENIRIGKKDASDEEVFEAAS